MLLISWGLGCVFWVKYITSYFEIFVFYEFFYFIGIKLLVFRDEGNGFKTGKFLFISYEYNIIHHF